MAETRGNTRPSRTIEDVKDEILKKILLLSFTPQGESQKSVIYLEKVAAELLSEETELKLSEDTADRAIMERLSEFYPGSESPFEFLINSYKRATEEQKKVTGIKDPVKRSNILGSIQVQQFF